MVRRSVRELVAGWGFMLLPLCAFGVHQLRFELGYGSRAGAVLATQGHGYLTSLGPWVALLFALGVGRFLVRVARSLGGTRSAHPTRSFAALWSAAATSLVAVYVTQEWLEGVFLAGHPAGFAGVFAHGGWWAVPLAALAGLVVAAVLSAGAALVAAVAPARPVGHMRGVAEAVRRPGSVAAARSRPLAARSAGRAPPPPVPRPAAV